MPHSSPRILAVTNQKGGVGKTTTAINLGAALARMKKRVLIVDLDPQGNASTGLGIVPSDRMFTTYDLLVDEVPLRKVVLPTQVDGLFIAPATTDLSSTDVDLVNHGNRTGLLRAALRGTGESPYDIILIDCPPSLSLLTVNALVAADSALVPLQTEFFALEGLSQLLLTVREVRDSANPDLRIEGVVLTMYDQRNNLCRQVEEDARETLGDLVYQTRIPRNVRVSEAPSYALPVIDYDPGSKGSEAYLDLAQEFLERNKVKERV
ncbi:ParA family protein [Roseibacterium sp. SDUM158016]|jgi:chromosome partitioning protein|uniref:ParA family protein n=1 Tax=Roseicyclus sediminis TaxID=2980997 RepID=UPI0021CFAC6C|nr:ParA family protein [Roseibacterium sp. SDUM158016]MCU4652281.1 ParA family protein [Roseibacterium sp. SDUM158016]